MSTPPRLPEPMIALTVTTWPYCDRATGAEICTAAATLEPFAAAAKPAIRTEGKAPDRHFTRAVTRRYIPGRNGICWKQRSFSVAVVFCTSRQPPKS